MRLRAFLFEDDKQMRDMLTTVLENRGYQVLAFSDPLDCPIVLDCECPCPKTATCGDIFLLDMNMPGMNGLDFLENQIRFGCRGLRQNKALMSGNWSPEWEDRAHALGCRIFRKPFHLKELTQWLTECEARIPPQRELAILKTGEKRSF